MTSEANATKLTVATYAELEKKGVFAFKTNKLIKKNVLIEKRLISLVSLRSDFCHKK